MLVSGATGAAASWLFGGIDKTIVWLTVFVALDWVSGLCASLITREASSARGFRGLVKKALIFAIVVLCHGADVVLGTNGIRDTVVAIALANEVLSIVENIERAGLGAYIPPRVRKALKQLKDEQGKEESK